MSIITEKEQKLVLVCIYDPLPLEKIWVDRIRQEKLFEIISILENNVILLGNRAKNIESSIQLTRLEYVDSNTSSFKSLVEKIKKFVAIVRNLRNQHKVSITTFAHLDLTYIENMFEDIEEEASKRGYLPKLEDMPL